MSDVNEEMKATADYAIKSAKERYGLDLDYSEESLAVLDNILEKIYWGFSSHTRDEGEGGLVYNTAIIWGSYLGEYMCLKWGGTWTVNGSDRRVSITSIEFSPISLVFQKITNHPEYSVENYVKETKKVIYTSVIHPKKSQYVAESVGQPKEPAPSKPVKTKAPVSINRSVIYIGGGILALMVVAAACIFGYSIVKSGGFPAFGLFADITSTSTNTPEPTNTATLAFTATPSPTVTDLPTYTPKPTDTPLPTFTPTLTFTPLPSETPTETPYPTDTEIPYRSPTPTTRPSNTPTERPVHPSDTPLPPITLESCSVSPSTVDRDTNTQLTLSVRFSRSTPGYGFTAVMSGGYQGQSGCSGTDDGSGTASCEGTSGQLPGLTTVRVTFSTDVGDCVSSYSSR